MSCVEGLLFETQVYEEVTNVEQDILFDYLYVLPPGVYVTVHGVATSNSLGDSTGVRALLDRTVNNASIITQKAQCTVIVLGGCSTFLHSTFIPGDAAILTTVDIVVTMLAT